MDYNQEKIRKLQEKVNELRKELEILKKVNELEEEVEKLKRELDCLKYPVYPVYPVYPCPTYPPWTWTFSTTDSTEYNLKCNSASNTLNDTVYLNSTTIKANYRGRGKQTNIISLHIVDTKNNKNNTYQA